MLVFQTRPSPRSCAKPAQPDIGSLAVFRPNKSKRSAAHPHIWLALMRKCWIIPFATVLGYDTFSGKLICWVPAALIPLAQIGIDANPVDCIRWLAWRIFVD